jgi:hypothetical protein
MKNTNEIKWTEFAKLIEGNAQTLFNLKFRWIDEKDYEDFNDHIQVVRELFTSSGFDFKKWTKRGELVLESNVKLNDKDWRVAYTAKFMSNGNWKLSSAQAK